MKLYVCEFDGDRPPEVYSSIMGLSIGLDIGYHKLYRVFGLHKRLIYEGFGLVVTKVDLIRCNAELRKKSSLTAI